MIPRRIAVGIIGAGLLTLLTVECGRSPGGREVEIRRFSMDALEGIIQTTGVELDKKVKTAGTASVKFMVTEPSIIRLFETGPLDIEEATLVFRARLRTKDAQGNVYLEMWCRFPGKGEFFSRGPATPLRGSNDWVTEEIEYPLKTAEKPDDVKLNIVSEGPGVIWIDDIRLFRRSP